MTKRKESYEEVHKRLVDSMREAAINDDSEEFASPELDLSFLDTPPDGMPCFDGESAVIKMKSAKKERFTLGRFGKVAAVLIIVLLGMNVVLLATDSVEDSYGDKGILHRIKAGVQGIYTDEEQEVTSTDVVERFVINDAKEIDLAIEFFPELYVPEYIPIGFTFSSMDIKVFESGDVLVEYKYKGKQNDLEINQSYPHDYKMYEFSNFKGSIINLEDRVINVYENPSENGYVVDMYTEYGSIHINGMEGKNDIIRIAKGLKK